VKEREPSPGVLESIAEGFGELRTAPPEVETWQHIRDDSVLFTWPS